MSRFTTFISLLRIFKNSGYLCLMAVIFWGMAVTKAQDFPIGTNLNAPRFDINPISSLIAVGDENGVTILAADDLSAKQHLAYPSGLITALEWSSSGQKLAIAVGNDIDIWAYAANDDHFNKLKNLQGAAFSSAWGLGISSISWRSDASQILGVASPRAYVWDVSTSEVVTIYEPSPDPILSAAWSSDGGMIALGDLDGSLTVHHLDTNQFEKANIDEAPAIFSIAWSPDSLAIAASASLGDNKDMIRFFVLEPFLTSTVPILTDTSNIVALEWNTLFPNMLTAGSTNGDVRIWNLNGLELIEQFQISQPVASLSWSADGTQLLYMDDGIQKHQIDFAQLQNHIPDQSPLRGMFSEPNCVQTCYLGIVAGVTSKSELEQILLQKNIPFESGAIGPSGKIIIYTLTIADSDGLMRVSNDTVYVDVVGDTVDLITLFINELSMNEITAEFGTPDAVIGTDRAKHAVYVDEGLIFSSSFDDPADSVMIQITAAGCEAIRIAVFLEDEDSVCSSN